MNQTLIKNCTLINRGERFEGASILIEGQRIKKIFKCDDSLPSEVQIFDATGLLCIPGVIDDQVHFRDPGLTHKGDLSTESLAALKGGVTSFMDMPNTLPQTTSREAWEEKMILGKEKSWVNYSFFFGATNTNADEVTEISSNKHVPGIKVFLGASTGNMLVDNMDALRAIFSKAQGIVAIHSEDEEIIKNNKANYQEKYGEDPDVQWHPYIRSREACVSSTTKAINLAKECHTRLHVLHLSTADEIELLKQSPEHITGEVCLHHLWFDDSSYKTLGTKIKWNPAIKTIEDREALRDAVREGIIKVVATDHAPHLPSEKEGGCLKAASGGPLVQHSLVMMLKLARDKEWSIEKVVDTMCHGPADLFGIEGRGYLDEGAFADIVLIDPNAPWVVSSDNIASKCGWSPMTGYQFQDQVKHIFLNGQLALYNTQLVEKAKGAALPLTFMKSEVYE